MRYRTGSISLSDSADIPLLLSIRNARALTFDQVSALACIDGMAKNRRVLHWRLSRLERCGFVQRTEYGPLPSQPVISITRMGLECLESRGYILLSLPATSRKILQETQILHSIELAAVRIALAGKGILRSWKWELEIVSENLVSGARTTKDYDAIVEVAVGNATRRFGIEFERTLKGVARYEELRRVFNAEPTVDTILYLIPNADILYVLAMELRDVRKRIGFALSKTFQTYLLDSDVLLNNSSGELVSFHEFLTI
jgi:hypothetical protein